MGSIMFTGVGGSGKDNTDVSVLLAQIGNIADLTTDDKSSLVAAINELNLDIGAMANGLKYQGTIGADGTVSALPSTHQTGWMYKVVTADTYAGQACEVGDMIICVQDGTVANDTDWSVVQGNTDRVVSNAGTSTADHVAVFADSSGLEVKDGGYTIAASVPSDARFTDTTYTFEASAGTDGGVDIGITDGSTESMVNVKGGAGVTVGKTNDSVSIKSNGTVPTVICNTAANDPNKVITIPDFDPTVSQEFYIQFTNGVFDESEAEAAGDDYEALINLIIDSVQSLTINTTQVDAAIVYPEGLSMLNATSDETKVPTLDFAVVLFTDINQIAMLGGIKGHYIAISDDQQGVYLVPDPAFGEYSSSCLNNAAIYSSYSTDGQQLSYAAYDLHVEGSNLVYESSNQYADEGGKVSLPLPGKAYTLSSPVSQTNGNANIQLSDGETSQSVKMVGKNGINIYTGVTANEINVYSTGITAIADLPVQDGENPAVFYTGAITATSVNGWDNSVSPQIITVQFPAVLLATNGGAFTLSIDGDDALPICYAAGMNLSSYFYSIMTAYGVNPLSQYGAIGYPITGSGMCLDLLFDGEQFSITSTQSSGLTNYAQIAAFDSKNQALTSYVRALSIDGDTITVTKGDATQSQITLPTESIGDLSSLETTDKTSLVGAINEITVPITNNLSLTGAQSVTLTNGSENRIGEMSSLTLTLPSPIPDDYISILSFTSGATATALDYGENIKWVNGSTDVIDGIFVPIPNTRYTIVIRYDGQYVCGEVGGVAIEQTTD